MTPGDLFRRISTLLEHAGIPYMLTGSFASSIYGMHRGSADVDFIIEANEMEVSRLLGQLPKQDFYSDLNQALDAFRHQSMFNVMDHVTGLKIDFIFLKVPRFQPGRVSSSETNNGMGGTSLHRNAGGYRSL